MIAPVALKMPTLRPLPRFAGGGEADLPAEDISAPSRGPTPASSPEGDWREAMEALKVAVAEQAKAAERSENRAIGGGIFCALSAFGTHIAAVFDKIDAGVAAPVSNALWGLTAYLLLRGVSSMVTSRNLKALAKRLKP